METDQTAAPGSDMTTLTIDATPRALRTLRTVISEQPTQVVRLSFRGFG